VKQTDISSGNVLQRVPQGNNPATDWLWWNPLATALYVTNNEAVNARNIGVQWALDLG
jgi:hypothetical protein